MIKSKWIETIREIESNQEAIRRRPYGIIEASNGKLVRIQLRPWPMLANMLEAHWIQSFKSNRHQKDVCRLYYNQPLGHRNFLALAYVESSLHTSLRTCLVTLNVLDRIAFIKRSDAILAEVSNSKISDRSLARQGWERHMEHKPKRHWIKRFYGSYPDSAMEPGTTARIENVAPLANRS